MKMARNLIIGLIILIAVSPANADSFYRGKRIEMIISNAAGGGYDLYGRAFAKYYEKHLPGHPEIVIRNKPGAGGMSGIKYTLAKNVKDGTHINFVQPSPFLWSAIGVADFDASSIEWIGSLNRDIWIILADSQSVKSWNDLTNSNVFIGTTSAVTDGAITARLVSYVLNKNVNIVSGYKNNPEALLGLERGEIFATSGHTYATTAGIKPDWLTGNSRYRVVLIETVSASPKLPTVPTILDITQDNELKDLIQFVSARYDLGRPIWAAPGTNPSRLKILREAFDITVKDPDYIEELRSKSLDSDSDNAEHLERVVAKLYSTKKNIIEKASSIVTGK
jgi:tripartite-type tricarboxylate transporter receptor subunit TctC